MPAPRWYADDFRAACTLSLSYLPRVTATPAMPIGLEDLCEGGGCDDMHKAAFVLVRKKVSGELSPDGLLQQLAEKQREVYRTEATLPLGNCQVMSSGEVAHRK